MPTINYGKKKISFKHEINDNLKDAYLSVDAEEGVVFKSPPIDEVEAEKIVSKKAGWVYKKLKLVESEGREKIVTGSRLLYLGKEIYTEVIPDKDVNDAKVMFTQSKFKIYVNKNLANKDLAIELALEDFYKARCNDKILPRVEKIIKQTGLKPADIKFRKLNKRWGSCTKDNTVIFNFDIIKLPFSLIDYVIVHELCHIQEKHHSKDFWNLVSKFMSNYKELDENLQSFKQ